MSEQQTIKVVDAFDLDDELRSLLKPGEMVRDGQGRRHRLPRYFYEIPSREAAMSILLTPHFGLNEFILADLKEAPRLLQFPRYVPCAVRVLAFYLEQFRAAAGAMLFDLSARIFSSSSRCCDIRWGPLFRLRVEAPRDQMLERAARVTPTPEGLPTNRHHNPQRLPSSTGQPPSPWEDRRS